MALDSIDGVRVINAHQLREWADAASSYRDVGPFWLVYHEGAAPTIVAAERPPTGSVFGVCTHAVEERPKPSAVKIRCEGAASNLAHEYDAVFWSEAAVEKFVFPYYASKSLWDAGYELKKLEHYWYGKVPVHDVEFGPIDAVPFAVAHTPDSDWNTISIEDIGPSSSQLHLLVTVKTAEGEAEEVYPVRLSHLPWPPPGGTEDRPPHTPAAKGDE